MRSSSNKDASPLEATYTLLDHMKMPAPPLDPAKLSVLELYGGTGLPGTALKDQGIGTAGRSWNLEKDAIPATTSASVQLRPVSLPALTETDLHLYGHWQDEYRCARHQP